MFRGLLSEWHLPMFSMTDTNGKVIDLKATFNPSPEKGYIAVKAVFLAFNTSPWSIPSGWKSQARSFVRSFPQDTTLRSVDIAWGLFTAAINVEVFVAIPTTWWTLVFEKGDPVVFRGIYEHGILVFMVGLDAYIIHRIPIRWKQIMLVYTVLISYLIRTGIHAISGIGNPTTADSDPETNDDFLYGSLNWNERPGGGVILVIILIFVAVPIIFLLTWSISICIPRRYSSEANAEVKKLDPNRVM